MSEWQDQQRAAAKANRHALQQRIQRARAARKRRKLDADEKKTAARLKELIKTAKAGEFIQNKTLKRWLTKEQFDSIAERWDDELLQREQWAEKPDEIKEYEERLRHALLIYNRADAYSRQGKHKTAKKLMNEADRLFERMLERLQEITHADLSLASWFDRDLDFSANGNLGLNPDQIPRVRTSRSLTNNSAGFTGARQTIADIKLSVLEQALDELIYETDDKPAVASSKLRDLLRGNDEDEY
jgi:tetratricopeptide (TPR) repeat protein